MVSDHSFSVSFSRTSLNVVQNFPGLLSPEQLIWTVPACLLVAFEKRVGSAAPSLFLHFLKICIYFEEYISSNLFSGELDVVQIQEKERCQSDTLIFYNSNWKNGFGLIEMRKAMSRENLEDREDQKFCLRGQVEMLVSSWLYTCLS